MIYLKIADLKYMDEEAASYSPRTRGHRSSALLEKQGGVRKICTILFSPNLEELTPSRSACHPSPRGMTRMKISISYSPHVRGARRAG